MGSARNRGRIRFGILGAGGIAHLMHLPELGALGRRVEVRCLQGRSKARLELLCRKFGVPHWTNDPGALLADPEIDAVAIATPHPRHVSLGLKALKAGKHVLMQKPLCGRMEEANAFARAAIRSRRVVMVLPHFAPAVVAMRDLVRRGAVGRVSGAHARASHGGPEVYYAQVRSAFRERGRGLWFFDARKASVGALFDMGVYAVAMLVAVLGTVRRVTGVVKTFDKPTALEDTATLILEFASGALATAETGWCDPARYRQLRVHGTRGQLVSPGKDGAELTRWIPGSYVREDVPARAGRIALSRYDLGSAHAHFVSCILRGRRPPLSNVLAARHVTEVLLAGLASSRRGRTVTLATRCP